MAITFAQWDQSEMVATQPHKQAIIKRAEITQLRAHIAAELIDRQRCATTHVRLERALGGGELLLVLGAQLGLAALLLVSARVHVGGNQRAQSVG